MESKFCVTAAAWNTCFVRVALEGKLLSNTHVEYPILIECAHV